MTNTYAFGIHEVGADETIWLKVDAPDNRTFFTSLGETLEANSTGNFSVADVVSDLKDEFKVLGFYVQDDAPSADHTPHLYDEASRTITIQGDDSGVTFQINTWLNRYGLGVVEDTGTPVL